MSSGIRSLPAAQTLRTLTRARNINPAATTPAHAINKYTNMAVRKVPGDRTMSLARTLVRPTPLRRLPVSSSRHFTEHVKWKQASADGTTSDRYMQVNVHTPKEQITSEIRHELDRLERSIVSKITEIEKTRTDLKIEMINRGAEIVTVQTKLQTQLIDEIVKFRTELQKSQTELQTERIKRDTEVQRWKIKLANIMQSLLQSLLVGLSMGLLVGLPLGLPMGLLTGLFWFLWWFTVVI
ncbi:hypothetical protein CONLIGDRAFT_709749 [Coniochaeta ligniaria NRRL 30616]|uniref:DUF1640-domain-containing protein n=1 Tax=Coniochaeta ligniaria NRRL 30616 TaxID=1408157 RepID=A0A1J7JWG7_9PEZI|nr:hypothetical protein CONLIGDRAFT_709749 [Coniochaeta ligniaria NRRL 30616]